MRLPLLSLAFLGISDSASSLHGFCNTYCKPSLAIVQEATCKKTTAIAVEMAVEKTVEKEAGLCKKAIADAVNKTMEAQSSKKSIADAVNVEKEKETAWCKKNSVMVEKVGPFKSRPINKFGEIKKYYHNYEFSMDLRFGESDLQTNYWKQLLEGIV